MKDSTHVNPPLQRFIEGSSMCFIVHHDVRLEAHVTKSVDAFKVLLWRCVVVCKDKHLRPVSFVELALEMLCKTFKTFKDL